ncbi:MAG TPA: VF530 family protein [Ignavibacteriaceae bacterium]|nr:VF530 family protein [Ignavibacteriaceae bacterium]
MNTQPNNDPLHGITLEIMLNRLVDFYGWDKLGRHIDINCFNSNPSIKSSLKFLRKTPWAQEKLENFYLYYGNPPWRKEDS